MQDLVYEYFIYAQTRIFKQLLNVSSPDTQLQLQLALPHGQLAYPSIQRQLIYGSFLELERFRHLHTL